MVRRFVEQQQIRLLGEQAGEVRAHDPAAAHLARRPVKILFAKAEAGEDLLGLGFEPVAAQLVEPVVDIVVDVFHVLRLDGMVGVPGLDDAAELGEFRRDGRGQLDDGFVAGRRAFLRQIAEGHIPFLDDFAGIRRFGAEDDGKQRGFTRAVRADQPDAVPAVHLQRGVGEEHAPAIRLADVRESQHTKGELTSNPGANTRRCKGYPVRPDYR